MLQPVLHDIEKKILSALSKTSTESISESELATSIGLGIDQTRRGIEWLRHKGFVSVTAQSFSRYSLDQNGKAALQNGLPERRLIELLHDGKKDMASLQSKLGSDFGVAIGIAQKKKWVHIDGATLFLDTIPSSIPGEDLIASIQKSNSILDSQIKDKSNLESLLKRPKFIKEYNVKTSQIKLTAEGRTIDPNAGGTGIDVEAAAPVVYPARTHPLKDIIDEIREVFVTLGFGEIVGNMCQPGFWNFDALFTPQDHPAREMQDTFYLDSPLYDSTIAAKRDLQAVSAEHRKHWSAKWSTEESRKAVLRTHTTCVTIRHIAETKPESARIFSLGRVFRNEKPSYKHLAEFNQVEGVVVGSNVTLRSLMGIQKEFYRRMGMDKVKFWPTFFPYTEPSLQSMVYNETLGKWIELFGMGIFRPEVTRPLGIKTRVLAWGGGIERIAMLRYAMSDVRDLYANKISWLRGGRV